MSKKVLIEISLVDECSEKTNQEVVDEIFNELEEGRTVIPWCKKVDKVAVIDSEKLTSALKKHSCKS